MENVIDLTAADKPFEIETVSSVPELQLRENDSVQFTQTSEIQTSETATRENSFEASRGAARAVMILSALCGAIAGVILAITSSDETVLSTLSERISGSFGEIFLQRSLRGGAILLLEFLLGFFAFGDLFSWLCPIFAGMGGGFFIASIQKPVFLPSEIAVLLAAVLAGVNSAMFSQKLLGLASGKRSYLRGMSASEYTARSALILSIVIAAAIYEGIAAVNFV